jgi:hypothetical protein
MNNWKEQFDKDFPKLEWGKYSDRAKIITFIQSLLSQALTEAEGLKLGDDTPALYARGYNAHRSHVSEVKKKYLS